MELIGYGMLAFTVTVFLLSAIVLAVRRGIMPAGEVAIELNGTRHLSVRPGRKLLNVLAGEGIYLPAACGGRGSCGQCRVRVEQGNTPLLPTEAAHIGKREAARGTRLACMVTVRNDLSIRVPDEILEVRRLTCRVRFVHNVSTFLRELVLALPADSPLTFEAGQYVLLEAPPGRVRFREFQIAPPYDAEWRRLGLHDLEVDIPEPTVRAYSLANHPGEAGIATLVVRMATPPPAAPAGTPPGRVSSYLYSLVPGVEVVISGPFGEFHARQSHREMVFIAGGAGIAPMRAIILDQLLVRQSGRRMSLWYGVRGSRDICYGEEFDALARNHDNFSYRVALSEPAADEGWAGATGLIHKVLFDEYLHDHPAPDDAEYYLCGPPLMSSAVVAMLEDLGVDREHIFFDDFGS